MRTFVDHLADAELVRLARDIDGDLIDALIDRQEEVFTKNGRIKKTAVARALGVKCIQVYRRLEILKESLEEAMGEHI